MIITDENILKEVILEQIRDDPDDNILINLIHEYLVATYTVTHEFNDLAEKCQTDTLILNFFSYVLRKKNEIKKYLALEIKIFELLQPKLRLMELTMREFKEVHQMKISSKTQKSRSALKLEDFYIFFKTVLAVFNYSYFNFFKTDIMQELTKLEQLKELSALFDYIKKNKESKFIKEIEEKVPEYASIMYSIENIAFRDDLDEDGDLVDV